VSPTLAVALRNLGRNRRRTALTAGAIAFACLLLVFMMSMQGGTYGDMVDNATRMMTGHVQIQTPEWREERRVRQVVDRLDERLAALRALPEVRAATPRASAFAILSGGDRSFGGQVLAVVPGVEAGFSLLPDFVDDGRWLAGPGELVLGTALARNLGVGIGDEVVVLGTAVDGGVAAAAGAVVGLLDSGLAEIDRSLAVMPLADFRDAFYLGDAAHTIVVQLDDPQRGGALAPRLAAAASVPDGAAIEVLDWRELLPELEQMIELDWTSSLFMYGVLALMVTFSIANTFMMMVFERTREFGTLLAVGARPGFIVALLQLEAAALCGLGVVLGTLGGIAVTLAVGAVGIPLDEMGAELLRQYHMSDRLYPNLNAPAITWGPMFMFVATQLAALIPALRLYRMAPVEAMRA
jgi:ABC-type lipoprotein release transport system permease subunit